MKVARSTDQTREGFLHETKHLRRVLKHDAVRPQIVTLDLPPLNDCQLSGQNGSMKVLTECMVQTVFSQNPFDSEGVSSFL